MTLFASSSVNTELEVCLRQHCHKLKVVPKLNGAHLILPPASQGEASLAVRVYYPHELPASIDASDILNDLSSPPGEDLDGLLHFRKSFSLSVVFFVLTEEEQNAHLDDIGSFVRRAMHRLTTPLERDSSGSSTHVLLVSSSEAAAQGLIHFADALTPSKQKLKQGLCECYRQESFLPSPKEKGAMAPPLRRAAAAQTFHAMREWAAYMNLPHGEVDVLMAHVGSLEAVVQHAAVGFPGVPLEERTKQLLHQFFHSDVGKEGSMASAPAYAEAESALAEFSALDFETNPRATVHSTLGHPSNTYHPENFASPYGTSADPSYWNEDPQSGRNWVPPHEAAEMAASQPWAGHTTHHAAQHWVTPDGPVDRFRGSGQAHEADQQWSAFPTYYQ
jgi:hypothetical protein